MVSSSAPGTREEDMSISKIIAMIRKDELRRYREGK